MGPRPAQKFISEGSRLPLAAHATERPHTPPVNRDLHKSNNSQSSVMRGRFILANSGVRPGSSVAVTDTRLPTSWARRS